MWYDSTNFHYIVSHTTHVLVCMCSIWASTWKASIVLLHRRKKNKEWKDEQKNTVLWMEMFVIPTDCDNYDNETKRRRKKNISKWERGKSDGKPCFICTILHWVMQMLLEFEWMMLLSPPVLMLLSLQSAHQMIPCYGYDLWVNKWVCGCVKR